MDDIKRPFSRCGLIPLKKLTGDDEESVYLAVDFSGKYVGRAGGKVVVKTQVHFAREECPDFVLLAPFLRHSNIAKAFEVFRQENLLYTIFEYAPYGDLAPLVRRGSSRRRLFSEVEIHSIFVDILNGLTYLHANHIAHRDIKLNNVLLYENLTARLTDFGLSKVMHRDGQRMLTNSTTGTPGYQPPEVIRGDDHNPFVADIFSLGVLLYLLSTGLSPFDGDLGDDLSSAKFNEIVIKRMIEQKADLSKVNSPSLQRMIARMLRPDPLQRLLLRQVHLQTWTQNLNSHKLLVRTHRDYDEVLKKLCNFEQLQKILLSRKITEID